LTVLASSRIAVLSLIAAGEQKFLALYDIADTARADFSIDLVGPAD
jgi:hypothetical protein